MAEESPFAKIDRETKGKKKAHKEPEKKNRMVEAAKKFHTSAKEKGGY